MHGFLQHFVFTAVLCCILVFIAWLNRSERLFKFTLNFLETSLKHFLSPEVIKKALRFKKKTRLLYMGLCKFGPVLTSLKLHLLGYAQFPMQNSLISPTSTGAALCGVHGVWLMLFISCLQKAGMGQCTASSVERVGFLVEQCAQRSEKRKSWMDPVRKWTTIGADSR